MKHIRKFQGSGKFSNTPTGRAMQRQYDLEHGITQQKVLPEVEVFPNWLDKDENTYTNAFSIPLERRPALAMTEGESVQPYTPRKLEEQSWLNRTFGISGLDNQLISFFSNPGNSVPTPQTARGVEALASMSRGLAPVQIESTAAPKVIQATSSPSNRGSLTLLERQPARISPQERAGLPRGVRNNVHNPKKVPSFTITRKNAAKIKDWQWDYAYFKALREGNLEEVRRLRDLHFELKSGVKPVKQYRGSANPARQTYQRKDGSAVWLTPDINAAAFYTHGNPDRLRSLYVKPGSKILDVDGNYVGWDEIAIDDVPDPRVRDAIRADRNRRLNVWLSNPEDYTDTSQIVHYAKEGGGYDQVNFSNISDATTSSYPGDEFYPQIATRKTNNIKLADIITYDNNGKVIPLSRRDNFNSPDIRYGLLPWILGGSGATVGYGALNNDEQTNESQ